MHIEGHLDIQLACGASGVTDATLESGRPLQASRILEGLSPEKALHRLPMVFSLCGTAQSAAALGACEAALSIIPSTAQRQARGMLVWMESAREHLLRILLDWPGFTDESVARDGLPSVMRLLPNMTQAIYGRTAPFKIDSVPHVDTGAAKAIIAELRSMIDSLLGGTLPDTYCGFDQWIREGATMPARLLRHLRSTGWDRLGHGESAFLPPLDETMLHKHLGNTEADRFISMPMWQDTPCETTPLQRQQNRLLINDVLKREGNGLLTRLTARLAELAAIPDLLQAGLAALHTADKHDISHATDSGIGLAQVEAARGRLVHRVEIEDNTIRRYQILAPTEWNFHPHGVAVQGLRTLTGSNEDELRKQAALWLNAIDPCVGYQFQVHHHA